MTNGSRRQASRRSTLLTLCACIITLLIGPAPPILGAIPEAHGGARAGHFVPHALFHEHASLSTKSNRPSERVIGACNTYATIETHGSHAVSNDALTDVVAYRDRLLAYGIRKSQEGSSRYMALYVTS
jgi:hypothetical protein